MTIMTVRCSLIALSITFYYSWVSRDVTSSAQISVRHVGVPRGVKFM